MAEGRYVISRIGQILVVTLEGAAHAGTLSAAADTIAEIYARQRRRKRGVRGLGMRSDRPRRVC